MVALPLAEIVQQGARKARMEVEMCDVVKTDALLALLLSKRQKVSFRELRELRDRVVKNHPEVAVDVSAPSIDLAIHYYPHVFAIRLPFITRAKRAGRFFDSDYIQDEFLSEVPPCVAANVLSCLPTAG